jgi:Mrp family chromosome partitioning ATPase
MTAVGTPRPLAVPELLAALEAAYRGDFAGGAGDGGVRPGTAPPRRGPVLVGDGVEGVAAPASQGGDAAGGAAAPDPPGGVSGRAVVVLAAHAGAGASTVALALAEAAAARAAVVVVECGEATRSGLLGASTAELGVDGAGWRRGRRGAVQLARRDGPVRSLRDVPPPELPDDDAAAGRVLVVDAGWPAETVLRGGGWVASVLRGGTPVVVGRATVPGLRQLEAVLAGVDTAAVVAVVGPARWPGVVAAGCGDRLGAARRDGRVVAVPLHRRLEVTGVTGEPLPRPVAAAGRALWALLTDGVPAEG